METNLPVHTVNEILPTEKVLVLNTKNQLVEGTLSTSLTHGVVCISRSDSEAVENVSNYIIQSDLIGYLKNKTH